ncbi:MAG: GerMN domain-containing protein [Trueperaceae bacterium]|nr:MAG: GerMN domain-containing protein [Trueperaceae bacterium]
MRTVVLRVASLALLLLLVLVGVLGTRTLQRLPNTLIYFVKEDQRSFRLEAVTRSVRQASPEVHLRRALAALAQGPSASERAGGLTTAVPRDLELLDLRIDEDVLSLDFASGLEAGSGRAEMQARLNQILYTVTQSHEIDEVALFIEGRPLHIFSSEGIFVDHPWRRSVHAELPLW